MSSEESKFESPSVESKVSESKEDAPGTEETESSQFRNQIELVEFFNKKRESLDIGFLQHDANLSRVAQSQATLLQSEEWDGSSPIPGSSASKRYFAEGIQACVTEVSISFPSTAGKEYEANNARRALARIRDKLLQTGSVLLEQGLTDEGVTHAGFGFTVNEKVLYLVAAFSHQLATLEETVDFRSKQTFQGTMLKAADNLGIVPVGCTLEFFSEKAERWISSNFLRPKRNPQAKEEDNDADEDEEEEKALEEKSGNQGQALCTVFPWQVEFDSSDRSFSFDIDLPTTLQKLGYYDIPHGIFHLRMYGQNQNVHPVPSTEDKEYKLPDAKKHVTLSCASFPFPPADGTKTAEMEQELAFVKKKRLLQFPIEDALFLRSGELVPPGFEVFHSGPKRSKMPLLCFRKSEEEPSEGKETQGPPVIVEIAVAFGKDDIPPGFEVVKSAHTEELLSLRKCIPNEYSDDEDSDSEENQKDGTETSDDDPIYLCVRKSSDSMEVCTRGICDIFLQSDKDDVDQDSYEKLDILPGAVHAMFRIVGVGMEDLEPESGNQTTSAGLFDGEEEDSEEDEEDEEYQQDQNEDDWNGLDENGFGSMRQLDPDSLQGSDLGECILPTAESKRAELEEAERAAQATRIEGLIENARLERDKLLAENLALQKTLVPHMSKKKQSHESKNGEEDATQDEDGMGASQDSAAQQEKERQYSNALGACNDAQETLKRTREAYDKVAMDLQTRLDEKEARAMEIRNSFAHFKREIAKAAENSRTGKPIPMRIIKQFEETEQQKDSEVEKVRLKNINLRAQLRKLESALHEKEKLAEGLHLIDFEQLKIENQTLNEKIEERNEELHKLRKKTTTTVQVLTHIKEKLQFVQAEAVQLKSELSALDKETTASRDQLTKSKHTRDALRASNDARKRDQGFVNSTLLVKDYQQRKLEIKGLKRKIRDLQQKYSNLTGLKIDVSKPSSPAATTNRHE